MEKEKIVISLLEYAFLKKVFDEGYRYVARDGISIYVFSVVCPLWFFKQKPIKGVDGWVSDSEIDYIELADILFKFIKWEDEEPFSIEELIKLYELQERNKRTSR